MACPICKGYYTCWCEIEKMEEEIKKKKMELEILELKREKLYSEKNKQEADYMVREYRKI